MKLALALVFALCIIALASAKDHIKHKKEFAKWKHQHGKHYKTHAEHKHRFKIFKNNFDFVLAHDAKAKGFTVALNEFADQTGEEFRAWGNGMNITAAVLPAIRLAEDVDLPSEVDWTTKGAVTPVKNQGQCGSCWSFSATGSTEGAAFLKTGVLPNLSEQNLVDCSTSEGNMGCNGGLMDNAFRYIIKNKGIDSEASYPYTATGPNACRYNPANSDNTLSSFHDIPQGDEKSLQQAVATTPTSVAIDASHQSFQFYSGGVYYESECSSTQLDHGVLAVGYGTLEGKDYWLVKNSWGASWGLKGYIKMARGRNNNCGIATSASYPIV